MNWIVNAKEMKACDEAVTREFLMPQEVLMERAGLACAEEIRKRIDPPARVLVVCGTGNNGGDGYCIARLLFLDGYHTEIWSAMPEKKLTGVPKLQRDICRKYGIPFLNEEEKTDRFPQDGYDLIVDAVFGTGLNRNVEGEAAELLDRLNTMNGIKMSVDIPSGISADNGKILSAAFMADFTVTFACRKIGHVLFPGAEYSGTVTVKDIGIGEAGFETRMPLCCSLEKKDIMDLLPKRISDSHKGVYGKALVIAGSVNMCGASYLCAKAAYLTGAGLVKIYTPEENRVILQQQLPEAVLTTYKAGKFDERSLLEAMADADVVALGPGLGTEECAVKIVRSVLKNVTVPLIIDADGLNIIAEETEILKRPHMDILVTPHIGEMARLTGDAPLYLKENRLERASDFANEYNVICALKDSRTVTAIPYGRIYINESGNDGMAAAGSGDVLTGIVTGLAAQGVPLEKAAPLAVYLHGLAGDAAAEKAGKASMMASDILSGIITVLKDTAL